jgi:hypothetical protein
MTHVRRSGQRGRPRRILLGALSAALALAAAPALAVDEQTFLLETTADLARLCGAAPESPFYAAAIHMCQGYILGVHHFHQALAVELQEDVYCVEPSADRSRNEVMAAFAAWVAENPQVGETEALDGLLQWAAVAFPCE